MVKKSLDRGFGGFGGFFLGDKNRTRSKAAQDAYDKGFLAPGGGRLAVVNSGASGRGMCVTLVSVVE